MIYILFIIIAFVYLFNSLKKRAFVKLFERGSTIVSGQRGRGKDMAYCIVVNARKKNYISNVNYSDPKKKYKCFPLNLDVIKMSGNTYEDLTNNTVKPYKYPYPDDIDWYISDAGCYFPAQYHNELAKKYKGTPLFVALSRHLGDCNVHCNCQAQARLYLHLREQSDIFIVMKRCTVFFGRWVRLVAYVYDRAESAEKQIEIPKFGLGSNARDRRIAFEIAHGRIRKISFFSKIPYRYDSRRFKKIIACEADWEDEI